MFAKGYCMALISGSVGCAQLHHTPLCGGQPCLRPRMGTPQLATQSLVAEPPAPWRLGTAIHQEIGPQAPETTSNLPQPTFHEHESVLKVTHELVSHTVQGDIIEAKYWYQARVQSSYSNGINTIQACHSQGWIYAVTWFGVDADWACYAEWRIAFCCCHSKEIVSDHLCVSGCRSGMTLNNPNHWKWLLSFLEPVY